MRRELIVWTCLWACLGCAPSVGWCQDPAPAAEPAKSSEGRSTAPPEVFRDVQEARREAEVLHDAIHRSLHVIHNRYYREDEGLPLPAAIFREIFSDLERERNVNLRWLAVDGQAMNTDHKAKRKFEQDAVRALQAGRGSHEQVEDGVYRRAAAITLSNDCLKCHVPDRKSTEDRTAGLIIAIPLGAATGFQGSGNRNQSATK